MKKLLSILACMMVFLTACADNDVIINFSDLPMQAQKFIQKHFNISDVEYIEKEREGAFFEYNIYLKNATEIDFDHRGNLQSIDCKYSAVPEGIIPELITHYTTLHYPNQIIVEYAIEHRYLKIELSNDLDLLFDHDGNFLRIDD